MLLLIESGGVTEMIFQKACIMQVKKINSISSKNKLHTLGVKNEINTVRTRKTHNYPTGFERLLFE
jgi:hypothetical protein